MNYLKDEQYYVDFYDFHTIKNCINEYWALRDGMEKRRNELKEMDDEKFKQELNKSLNWFLYITKGNRYKNKKKTIDEWIARDKKSQDKLDNTLEPENNLCSFCKVPMKSTLKHLENYSDQPLRVIFLFECPKCKKKKWIIENGEEWKSKPPVCSKCSKKAETIYKKKGRVVTWTTKCLSCGYKKIDIDDFDKSEKERKEKKVKDKKLLEKYRKEMCFDDKAGQEFIELKEAMEVANVVHDEVMHKYDNLVYERALKLKKTKIADLEKLLIKSLEKAKYTKLTLDKPEINEYVIVPFTIQDSDSNRRNRESINEVEKIIKETLEDTNWRLLTGSTCYRIGYLQGRLKGYEREEDMLKLVGKKEEVKPKPKIDEAMRQKYASNNLVQIAKLTGEHEGIENMRKRRLAKEPEGFFLEADKGPYTCSICGENRYGNEMWWTPDGLRCADCWRNIQEKIIPPLDYDHDNKVWIKDWQIQSGYNVHPMTARKLRRLGELVGRDLKRKDGLVYCTVYLVSENKEFLEKHPKNKSKIEITIKSSDENK